MIIAPRVCQGGRRRTHTLPPHTPALRAAPFVTPWSWLKAPHPRRELRAQLRGISHPLGWVYTGVGLCFGFGGDIEGFIWGHAVSALGRAQQAKAPRGASEGPRNPPGPTVAGGELSAAACFESCFDETSALAACPWLLPTLHSAAVPLFSPRCAAGL